MRSIGKFMTLYQPIDATVGIFVASQLRCDEIAFLEGGTEIHAVHGSAFERPAAKGAAWAASLAIAMRPQLFALGAAPLALAGLAPRLLFRAEPEAPLSTLLDDILRTAVGDLHSDLGLLRRGLELGDERLAPLYGSSRARDAWRLVFGLGPITRAEIARGLGVTKRTASMAIVALEATGLVNLRVSDNAVLPRRF